MILSSNVSLLEDIVRANKAGFDREFRYSEERLIDRQTEKQYLQSECNLVEYSRHEGMNDPGDSTILFLISCQDGIKGFISNAYGVYADVELMDFVMGMEKALLRIYHMHGKELLRSPEHSG
jgi:hypothetical protein